MFTTEILALIAYLLCGILFGYYIQWALNISDVSLDESTRKVLIFYNGVFWPLFLLMYITVVIQKIFKNKGD